MPNNCFCDQRGLGDPTQTCGDCPEDYREGTKRNAMRQRGDSADVSAFDGRRVRLVVEE